MTQIWHITVPVTWHRLLPVLCLADFPVFLACVAFDLLVPFSSAS